MTKKILLTICVAAFTAGAFAQSVSFGIKAGVNFSTQHFPADQGSFNVNNKTGFNVGAMVDIAIHKFSIQPALYFITKGYNTSLTAPLYSNGGSQIGTVSFKGSTRLNYLELPVNLLYHVKLAPDMNLHFGAGPYLGYGLSGKQTSSYIGSPSSSTSERNITFGGGLDWYKNPDCGVNFIVGQRLKHFSVDVNYSLGLVNVVAPYQNYKAYNRSIGISLGYMLK